MKMEDNITHFASPERAADDIVKRQIKRLSDIPFLQQLYDAVTDMVVILNQQRQIVFYNQNVVNLLKLPQASEAILKKGTQMHTRTRLPRRLRHQ